MKQEIKPATGRLGVLVVGVGGAVATTMIVGTLASRKGLAKPIGSITQLATMRMENNEEKLIKDVVPLTNLEDIVFGGWDIFPDNAYEAAMYAEVLHSRKHVCTVDLKSGEDNGGRLVQCLYLVGIQYYQAIVCSEQ